MKKWVGLLLSLVMVLCMVTTSFAATAAEQVVTTGGTIYYDAAGNALTGANVQFPGGNAVVELSKTVASTGVENEFLVSLQVRTSQDIRELHSDTPDAAVLLILDVSNSMDDCDICGQEATHTSHVKESTRTVYYCYENNDEDTFSGNGNNQNSRCNRCNRTRRNHRAEQVAEQNTAYDHDYVSRLSKAKEAAIQFVDDFATQTGVEEGDARYVAIVDFGSTAYRRLNWVDVTSATNLAAAKAAINNLTVAHSGVQGVSDDGGTNIEGALKLGANIWEAEEDNGTAIGALNYKYTIMLTDGNPTYHVTDNASDRNSTTKINGTAGGSNVTYLADAKDVGDEAERILGLSGLSRLYSICYGSVGDDRVWDHTAFGNWNEANPTTTSSMTIGEWLEKFSTAAYDGSAAKLFDTFNSVISQIQLATQAWKVDDEMGEHVVWGGEVEQNNVDNQSSFTDNKLHWDVLASDLVGVQNVTVGSVTYPVLTYAYNYKVTLDNLDTDYVAGADADTNNLATLSFSVKDETTDLWLTPKTVDFPEPAVEGYAGTLNFTKVWNDNGSYKPMAGVQFTLTSKDTSAEGESWTATATSDANGNVSFSGIPSGHSYSLTEAVPAGYAAPGAMDVSVALGVTTFNKLDSNNYLLNEKSEKDVTLVLNKDFGNSTSHPDEITFTIVNSAANYSRTVTLNDANGWSITLPGLPEGDYVITEHADYPGYDLTQSATLNGAATPVTYNNVKVALTLNAGESHRTHTVTFKNEYVQQVGKVSVEKSFWERDHEDLLAGSANPKMVLIPDSLLAGMEIEIDLVNDKGQTAYTFVLNQQNGWAGSVPNLPVGEYTINEIVSGVIPERDFLHLHVYVNGVVNTSNKITVDKGADITLKLENHYTHQMGDIYISKRINGIADSDIPAGTVFYVDVYRTKADAEAGTNVVTTIEVRKLSEGAWNGTSKDIPVGEYYLKERTPSIPGYDFISGVFQLAENKITVTEGTASATAVLVNTFEEQTGTLTVKKDFVLPEGITNFDYPDSIRVNVLDGSASGNIVETLELKADSTPAWTASIELPLGTYYLSEVVAEGVPGTADVKDFGVTASWSNATVVITDGADVQSTVTNTYTQDYGHLTITKEFDGAPDTNATITFVVYKKNADGSRGDVVETIVLPDVNGHWYKSVNLPVGEYLLFEYGAHNAFENYTLTKVEFDGTVWYEDGDVMTSVAGHPLTITKSADLAIAAKNTYVKDTALLTIAKVFEGDLTADDFANKSIDVLIYSNGQQVGNPITLNKANGWRVKDIQLDAGKTYTLVEVTSVDGTNTAYDAKHTLVHTWEGGAEVTLAKNDSKEKIVTNTYTRKTGTMTLNKIFTGLLDEDRELLGNASVEVTIMATNSTDFAPQTIILDRANNWNSGTITLPVGDYTLSEVLINIDGYTHKDAVFSSISGQVTDGGSNSLAATLTILPDQTAAVGVTLTNTMERQLGGLSISKKFNFEQGSELSEAYFADKKIDVHVYHEDHLYKTVTLTAANKWTVTLENVPTGAYTVEEVTAAGAANTAHVDNYGLHVGYTNNNNTVAVETNQNAEMAITNDYTQHVGYIRVKKTFTQDDASLAAEKFIPDSGIAIQVYDAQGNLEEIGYVSRQTGGAVTFGPLPVGTYKVVEVVAPGAAGSAYVEGYALTTTWNVTDGEVTVAENGTAEATVNNQYTREKGSLTITKLFAGCTDITKPEITVYVKQGDVTVSTVTLSAPDWSAKVEGLPTGTYTVVEDAATAAVKDHSVAISYSAANVTVGTTGAAVTITNTYTHDKAALTITKEFATQSALDATHFANKKINILVKRNGAVAATATLPTTAGEWTVTLTDLLAGEYTVEEVTVAGETNTAYVADYGLTVTYTNNGAVTVTKSATPAAMVVTNSYTHDLGSMIISKAFATESALDATHFANKKINILVKRDGAVAATATLPTEEGKWETTLTGLPVGEYTVEEVTGAGETNTAYVADYGLTVTYTNNGKVTVTKSATPAAMVVTNSYTRETAELSISKAFAEGSALKADAFSSINVEILKKDGTLVKTIMLEAAAEKPWIWTGMMPVGDYVVREVTEPNVNGSAYRAGYGLTVAYSDAAKNGSVSLTSAADAEMTITNSYSELTGSLMIKKEFKGAQYLYPASVEFTVTGSGFSQKVTVSAANNWTATIGGLYAGEYTVTEALVSGYDYDLTTTWSSEGGKIVVTPGQTAVITCTNAYYPKQTVSFRIPVEKTVYLSGAKAPAEATQFSFGTSWQGSYGVTVRFENDPSNTLGTIQQTSANTYAATLNGAGTVKGYIVIEGYADQLAGFKLQTWENLTGFANEEAAEAAGWTFDKTATDGAVNWTVQIGYGAQTGLVANVARTDTGAASKISFENVYTSPIEVPETGDGENLALWIALCTVSALGVALLVNNHKRRAFSAGK